jgi:tetratricopeptide (TPR) repeat protein
MALILLMGLEPSSSCFWEGGLPAAEAFKAKSKKAVKKTPTGVTHKSSRHPAGSSRLVRSSSKKRASYYGARNYRLSHKARPVKKRVAHAAEPQGPADPLANVRTRNYSLLNQAYLLFDQGVNARLKGDYGIAADKLSDSVSLCDQARSLQREGLASTLEASIFYELGLAAAEQSDLSLARDSFVHSFKANPQHVEAYIQLVQLLLEHGQGLQAAHWLDEGLLANTQDLSLKELKGLVEQFLAEGPSEMPERP